MDRGGQDGRIREQEEKGGRAEETRGRRGEEEENEGKAAGRMDLVSTSIILHLTIRFTVTYGSQFHRKESRLRKFFTLARKQFYRVTR